MTTLRTIRFLTLLSMVVSAESHASDFDLRISDDTVQAAVAINQPDSDIMYGLGYLYKDDDESINTLNVDLHAKGQTAISNLPTTVGVGLQTNLFKVDEFKGSAIGIGGSVRINLPDTPGLSIESEAHYAPDVLAFGDSDAFSRLRLQLNYRVIPSADVSLGYRYLNTGVKDGGNETLESGIFVGMKIKF